MMDDKAGRRGESEAYGRRGKQKRNKVWRFLNTHKNSLFTGAMVILMVVLLFGIFSQFQPPSTNTTPNGVTAIDYSTFVQQVKSGNVLATAFRGDEVNGLLQNPLSQHPVSPSPQGQNANTGKANQAYAQDYGIWSRYVNAEYTSTSGVPPLAVARMIYTRMPVGGDTALMGLLVANHVNVTTLTPSQNTNWLSLLGRLLPFIVLVVIALVFMASRNNARPARSVDDRMSQMGRSRARRFVRPGEVRSTQQENNRPIAVSRTGTNAKNATSPRVSLEPPVTFADVAGIDEVRAELEEIVQFLRSPDRFTRLGARIPRGALLVGPPGTGKTLLAKAVAGEADVPFFSISASEFVEMFVGVGASRVRDLFNQARQAAPCVIFIDEIDAVGRKRSMRVTGNDERDQTLNQLLVELDGFDARKAIVVMAATNRVDILDKALLRPGRFDRHINVSVPDRAGREAILKVHTRKTPLHEEVNLERLSRLTVGMSGADLANLVNEAALSAARRDMERVDHECFEEALARVQLGALRPLVMSERERRIIAYHEGGHALVAYHLPEADTVNRVTILPRGQSLGVTQFTAEEDRYNYSRHTLMARIAVGLGGRVAEELTFGADHVTTGAENDLQVVTDLARRMVTRWGMSEQVGVVFADNNPGGEYSLNMRRIDPADLPVRPRTLAYDGNGQLVLNGELPVGQHQFAMAAPVPQNTNGIMLNAMIDAEVQRILNEGRDMARQLLREHADQLVLLAKELMEHEQLDRKQFEALLKGEEAAE
ncbi:MAG: ATP-dependent zinc metalloprotease FtsH [Ktedonobacteraceae bacterium]|nr:ATP-dependent zinc metalloprotease FtsH [Ktedonobacteraceae bacterium]